MFPAFARWVKVLKQETVALWFCARNPRTPFIAKALAAAVVLYAFSPIDLIPDFIPVVGYLDDLILLPIGVWVVRKLVPGDVMSECRVQAAQWIARRQPKPRAYLGAAVIVLIWLLLLWLAWRWAQPWLAQ
jgi:uncharacterized membrane protein YkvA (DUF1232 family)